jgi:hypothetical protein
VGSTRRVGARSRAWCGAALPEDAVEVHVHTPDGLLKRGAGAATTTWAEDGIPGSFGDQAGAAWAITTLADTLVGALVIRFSTGTDAGDAELCRRMAKAKFDPARDPAGNKVPMQGFYVTFSVAQ